MTAFDFKVADDGGLDHNIELKVGDSLTITATDRDLQITVEEEDAE